MCDSHIKHMNVHEIFFLMTYKKCPYINVDKFKRFDVWYFHHLASLPIFFSWGKCQTSMLLSTLPFLFHFNALFTYCISLLLTSVFNCIEKLYEKIFTSIKHTFCFNQPFALLKSLRELTYDLLLQSKFIYFC